MNNRRVIVTILIIITTLLVLGYHLLLSEMEILQDYQQRMTQAETMLDTMHSGGR